MTTGTSQKTLGRAVDQLIERLQSLSDEKTDGVRRIEIEIDPIDPLLWLVNRNDDFKTYWRSRDATFELAGVGTADTVQITAAPDYGKLQSRIARRLADCDEGVRYYGGLRFDPSLVAKKRDSRWDAFGSCRFVLHRFELLNENGRHVLACNLPEGDLTDDRLNEIIATARELALDNDPRNNGAPTSPTDRRDFPDRDTWADNVRKAVDSFRSGRQDKLVLARRASMNFVEPLNFWQMLERLRQQSDNCFLFGVQPDPQTAFIGATPERLFRREHDQIFTEAMAGTRPRGPDDATDRALTYELSMSEKELWEHQLVVNGINAGLSEICENHNRVDGPAPFKLARIQHLRTRFAGRLKPDVDNFKIIAALHPSAAVGGYPVKTAPPLLHQFEPFDRGWYAGQVGWIGADSAELTVSIRCALLSNSRLDLFSGAGIVADSQPEAEWDEIEAKIGQFVRLLGEEAR